MGRYNGGDETPALDGLLASGIALDAHRSCSNWTYPALIAALSGQRDRELGFVPFGAAGALPPPLPGEVPWLAEVLAGEGFATGLASTNHILSDEFDTTRGYGDARFVSDAAADWTAAEALALADALADQPRWFLHAHFMDPHDPYTPPLDYAPEGAPPEGMVDAAWGSSRSLLELTEAWPGLSDEQRAAAQSWMDGLYRAEIRYLDDQLAALWSGLESSGALDDTLVVIFSDHGEQLWERGQALHGNALYAEETGAIAAILAPGLAPRAWTEPTAPQDLYPTILDALGLRAASQGASGAVLGTAAPDRPLFAQSVSETDVQQAVTAGDDALIYRWDGALERYDLAQDPAQSVDLHAPGDPISEALWATLAPEVEALHALLPDRDRVAP